MDGGSLILRATNHYKATKAEFGYSMRTMDAFQALAQAYANAGRRIDDIRQHEPDEAKRFLDNTRQGSNGHVYWYKQTSSMPTFRLNDGTSLRCLTYWWKMIYGVLPKRVQTCPTPGCISPYHAVNHSQVRGRLYPEHVLLGALQVWSMRHDGLIPREEQWDKDRCKPKAHIIAKRFGGWDNALKAAGLASTGRRALIGASAYEEREVAHISV